MIFGNIVKRQHFTLNYLSGIGATVNAPFVMDAIPAVK